MVDRDGKPVLIAALPWNLVDMISVQVGALKAFLCGVGIEAIGRHYYVSIGNYFSEAEMDAIHEHFLGDQLYAMILFPEQADAIGAQVRSRSKGVLNPADCAERLQQHMKEVISDIISVNPKLVGLTTTHMQYFASIYASQEIRKVLPETKVVLGGIALYGEPAHETIRLFSTVDYIISGEGEPALWRLSEHLDGKRDIMQVPQIIFRDGDNIVENRGTETVLNINSLPIPDYSDYITATESVRSAVIPRATIEMSRGCRWGKCSFCIEGLASRGGFRSRTPERVASGIQHYVENFRIIDYVTSDPDVAFNADIFSKVNELGLDLRFMVELSGLVRVSQFETMVSAGVKTVQIGIESFSPVMLESFKKGVSLCKYVELLRMCVDLDLKLVYNNIYGSPIETQENVDEAVENMKRLVYFQPPRLSEFRVSIGSEIINNMEKYGVQELLPSKELTGFPEEIAKKVGMLISFNAGYGFKKVDSALTPDYTRYHEMLDQWKEIWALKPSRVARRGGDFIRVDHIIGDEKYVVDIDNPIEIKIFELCQRLVKRRDIYAKFPLLSLEDIDGALDSLWRKHLVFVTTKECVSLVSLDV